MKIKYADGRVLYLQEYNNSTGEWEDKASFQTPSTHSAEITVKYPNDWGSDTKTKWRLYMKGTFLDSSYEGKTINCTAYNVEELDINSAAALAYDPSAKKILYAVEPHKRLPNASTTKLMTALVALKEADMDDTVTIQKEATEVAYASLGVKKGEEYKLEDLMYAMLMESSNDAAVAIADHVAGSVDAFAKEMNEQAKLIGCKNTNFMNPHGLDAYDHYSSAYDLALMDAQDMKYDLFKTMISTKKYSFKAIKGKDDDGKTKKFTIETSNDLLKLGEDGELGGKTGTTTSAGACLVNNFEYKGKTYITVVLNSKNRWKDTKALNGYIKKYA